MSYINNQLLLIIASLTLNFYDGVLLKTSYDFPLLVFSRIALNIFDLAIVMMARRVKRVLWERTIVAI